VKRTLVIVGMMAAMLGARSTVQAQPAATDFPWSVEFGIGWDNSIAGNINSSGVGRINGQAVVILKNSYEDVYGTGLHLRFGGGYMIDEVSEVRATFTFQSLDADLVPMGDIGVSKLYGQYQEYRSFGLDVGFRRYADLSPAVRAYGEATVGIAFIDETDVVLVAPQTNLAGNATDFYDRTAAFGFGVNVGVLVPLADQIGVFGQIGLRWMTGMSEVDGLAGTGLETINDNSSRWTVPIIGGVRARF